MFYFPVQIFDKIMDNARLVLQIDNARLAADDFKVKYVIFSSLHVESFLHSVIVSLIHCVSAHSHRSENEMAIRLSVEADIGGLKKVLDETNMSRLNIENEIEAVKEELLFLKKNHENVSLRFIRLIITYRITRFVVFFISFLILLIQQEVMELRSQISQSGVQVDVDAPKGQDLSQIMEDMRANYEKIAVKNAEDLKRWHENQVRWTSRSLIFKRHTEPLCF